MKRLSPQVSRAISPILRARSWLSRQERIIAQRDTVTTVALLGILFVLMVTGIQHSIGEQAEGASDIELETPTNDLLLDEELVSVNEALELGEVLAVGLLYALVHLFGPRFRRFMDRSNMGAILGSTGGGIAVAYLFLQLMPELEHAEQRLLGDSIHLVVLVGFVVFWGLEVRLQVSRSTIEAQESSATGSTFKFNVALGAVYNWLLIYAMPSHLHEGGAKALIGAVPIGIHLIYKDYLMGEHQSQKFDDWGRYILAVAPLIGWTAVLLATPSEVFSDLLIAVLTGYIIHTVFRSELPASEESNFRWFLSGAVMYALLLRVSSELFT